MQLKAFVAHHVEVEESEMLPLGRKSLSGKRLEDLGTRLAATRAQQAAANKDGPLGRPGGSATIPKG